MCTQLSVVGREGLKKNIKIRWKSESELSCVGGKKKKKEKEPKAYFVFCRYFSPFYASKPETPRNIDVLHLAPFN